MRKVYVIIALCAFVVPGDSQADVFKCADADGNIMYSQTPCDAQSSANVNMAGFSSQSAELDCSYANRFALSTARRMRVGATLGVTPSLLRHLLPDARWRLSMPF